VLSYVSILLCGSNKKVNHWHKNDYSPLKPK
jgi:hypothetical protein